MRRALIVVTTVIAWVLILGTLLVALASCVSVPCTTAIESGVAQMFSLQCSQEAK